MTTRIWTGYATEKAANADLDALIRTEAADVSAFRTRVTGDVANRIDIKSDRVVFGDGAIAGDLVLQSVRDGVDVLHTFRLQMNVPNWAPRILVENLDATANSGRAMAPINSKAIGNEITMNSHGTNYNIATLAGWGTLAVHDGLGLQLLSIGDLHFGTGVGTTTGTGYKYKLDVNGQFAPLQDSQAVFVPAALQAAVQGTYYSMWAGRSGDPAGFASLGFGAASTSRFVGVHARGTPAATTKLLLGDELASFAAAGYDGAGNWSGFQGALYFEATEDWNSAVLRGTRAIVRVTPTGTGAPADVVFITGSTFTTTLSFLASSSGPHAIGSASDARHQLLISGNFVPGGTGSGRAISIRTSMSPAQNGDAYGIEVIPTFVEQGAGVHATFAGISVTPTVTNGAATLTNLIGVDIPTLTAPAGTTNATGLRVAAPTGAANNYAINILTGDIHKAGTAYTNPDFVFEAIFRGDVVHNIDKPGAREFLSKFRERGNRVMTLAEVRKHAEARLQLPGVADALGIFDRADVALTQVELAYNYLWDHEARIGALERALDGAKKARASRKS